MKMNRVFLKLSGEALAGPKKTGFDEDTVKEVARQVKLSVDAGVQVGIVIGGGNFWRGRTSDAIERTKADQIGMLATVMNCIYVSEIFRNAPRSSQKNRQIRAFQKEKLYFLQVVQDIRISQLIQVLHCVPLRWKLTVYFLQRQLMVYMIAIQR